jgi:hypothetical protein
MLTNEMAKKFVKDWIQSFNSHQIEEILSHYDDEFELYSPVIPLLNFNAEGVIRTKIDLKKYFEIGLNTYPNLHFKLHNYFVGINTVVIYYTSVNNRMAAEVFRLNDKGKATKVYCNYSND